MKLSILASLALLVGMNPYAAAKTSQEIHCQAFQTQSEAGFSPMGQWKTKLPELAVGQRQEIAVTPTMESIPGIKLPPFKSKFSFSLKLLGVEGGTSLSEVAMLDPKTNTQAVAWAAEANSIVNPTKALRVRINENNTKISHQFDCLILTK